MTTQENDLDPSQLPATIRAFVAAHIAREVDAAMRLLVAEPLVVDQDETFAGAEQVRGFLRGAGTEFTYTTELVAARRTDAGHWVAVLHLEGDFPGGVADLDYTFDLAGDLIAAVRIR
ncbi:ketosteroid isomerase-like protein [Nocardioides cavernae]|uniref:Ketosteroid isomerase-like protein n=1 Tax=Nocardioides cavernae TaxID=1921566 RepID=A0A7Y9KR21_9ACTN|nr:nuclear transport factor 2 family protein [Nocardioides cavernae]NYE36134.1 ketosteroid isomerase-like protein [Nocardioides cavernae]